MADIKILTERANKDSLDCVIPHLLSNFYLHNKDVCPYTKATLFRVTEVLISPTNPASGIPVKSIKIFKRLGLNSSPLIPN